MDTWCPILQILIFYDQGSKGVERINLSFTDTKDLYDTPWKGRTHHSEQWKILKEIISERDPEKIGVNTGSIQWAAGGLTHNLYNQLVEAIPKKYVERLVSAEQCATRWLATLTDTEVRLYEHVVKVAHSVITKCYSNLIITPGVTTIEDLVWEYWQICADNGLQTAFNPFFVINREDRMKEKYGDTTVIQHGDFIRCDVGIKYLGLITDHQEWAYVLKPRETDAPEWAKHLMKKGNRLQQCFMDEFQQGLTGNQLLANILNRAKMDGLPNPKVYSHSLGHLLHEPGPLIGLPWEQEWNEGRGDVKLEYNYAFTMELSVEDTVEEWDAPSFRLALEQDVVFTSKGCRPIDGLQTEFHII
jgi:Xaa-Pro aminopeptidase